MKIIGRHIFCYLILTTVSACAVGPEYVRPSVPVPSTWNTPAKAAKMNLWPEQTWWTAFSDLELNQLEQAALRGNYDLKAAMNRIDQALAVVKVAGANLFPFLDGTADTVRSKNGTSSGGRERGSTGPSTSLGVQLAASYEADLWGKYRRVQEAAQASLQGSIYDHETVALSLTGDVATTYFQFLAWNDRFRIARETMDLEKKTLDIIEKRYRSGMVSGLDLAQAKTNLANVEASIFAIEQGQQQTLHALAVLLGQTPGQVNATPKSLIETSVPPTIPSGLPSALLERRPDIRRAEADLVAANADIGVARADMFPSIRLTAIGGYTSQSLSTLVHPESALYSLGASLLAPIFQGWRLKGEYERTRARYEELVQNYQKAILSAFRDVEDALVAIEKLSGREAVLAEAVAQAERSYRLAVIRYEAGRVDYLPVLEADSSLLNIRNMLVSARLGKLTSLVALYKALGGGWDGVVEHRKGADRLIVRQKDLQHKWLPQ